MIEPRTDRPDGNHALNRVQSNRIVLTLGLLTGIGGVLLCAASDADARGPRLAEIDDIRREGVRRSVFVLDRGATVEIEAEGAGDKHGEAFVAHAWILDLDSRQPVWTQREAPGHIDRRSQNWITSDELRLPAGTYGLYYATHPENIDFDKSLKILGIEIGKIRGNIGMQRDWDDLGDPETWGAVVYAADSDFRVPTLPSDEFEPYPGAEVRILGMRDGEIEEVAFELDRELDMEVWATGEWIRRGRYFADHVWMVDRSDWSRVWALDPDNMHHAGGADKNQAFSGTIRIPAGTYMVTVATDDSHATGSWNAAPPWDPDSWGLAMRVKDPSDRSAFHIISETARPEPVIGLTQVGDDEFVTSPFHLTREARILVRATGEQVSQEREFVDFGWIESVGDFEEVWSMSGDFSYPAGGARKNRLIEEVITLPAGNYSLCYFTDDSHSYDDWNTDAPFDPDFWGISIADVENSASPAIVPGHTDDRRAIVSITPVESDEHIVRRFEVTDPLQVKILAVGEGTRGEMHDFGWLERSSDGRVVWEMEYEFTREAGGARKNREVRETLSLEPGRYELHYQTDGSHAFGDWNASPPRRPHLWGITLAEIPK